MALSAADIQRAYTVNAPIGEILGKGAEEAATTTRQLQEAREKKDLENAKFLYETVDPLTVGMGNAADPHSNMLLGNLITKAQEINNTKGLSDAQKRVRIGQMALELKGYRENAMSANKRLQEQVAAAKQANPLIDDKVLQAEAVKSTFFDENNQPRTTFDPNIDYVMTEYNKNPNRYTNPLLAQKNIQMESEKQFIPFAGITDKGKQFSYSGKYNPNVQEVEFLPQGGAKLRTVRESVITDKAGNQYPLLPEDKTVSLENIKGFSRLQDDYIKEQINTNPELKDLPDLQKRKIAAWQITNSNMMPAQSALTQESYETAAMKAARGRSGGGGGTEKEPAALSIKPAYNPLYLAFGASDVAQSIQPATIDSDGSSRYNVTSEFPNGKFIIHQKQFKNNRTGNVRYEPEYGTVNVKVNPDGSRDIYIYNGSNKFIDMFKIANADGTVNSKGVRDYANSKYVNMNGGNATDFFQDLNKTRRDLASKIKL
jgi:hypothetical protein